MRLIHGVRFLRQKTFSPNKSHVSFTGFRFLSAVRVRPEVRDRWPGCRLQTGLLTGESFSSFSSSSSAAGAFPRSLGITHTHTHTVRCVWFGGSTHVHERAHACMYGNEAIRKQRLYQAAGLRVTAAPQTWGPLKLWGPFISSSSPHWCFIP